MVPSYKLNLPNSWCILIKLNYIYCKASQANISDHNSVYLSFDLEEPPNWIHPTSNFTHPFVIVRYPILMFSMGISPMSMCS